MRLLDATSQIKVSSTLDKSSNKKNLIDGSPETCWSSTQGTPQHIQATFDSPVIAHSISLTFQGGFVGLRCAIFVRPSSTEEQDWVLSDRIFPDDVNRRQSFSLANKTLDQTAIKSYAQLKLVFEQSSDFFGRIVVYDLSIDGDVV
ncbi:galactose-binding like protein [Clavulina sp. PMI_390]|nr:galactose-binding like protein [Clavulina sp. PMI_390]